MLEPIREHFPPLAKVHSDLTTNRGVTQGEARNFCAELLTNMHRPVPFGSTSDHGVVRQVGVTHCVFSSQPLIHFVEQRTCRMFTSGRSVSKLRCPENNR